MNMWRKAAEAWDRHLRRGVAGVLAAAMAISLLPAASWAAWPIIPPVQITEDTKSQFPNIEFQTNFVRTEYGTLTGLMEIAIRVGPSAKDENDKPIPVDFQSIAATLQFNTTLFQPISWRWAYGEMGEAPAPDLKLDAAGYYDVQLPAMKDDTLPGTGAIAQCGVVTGETDMSDNVNSGDQALLFFKAEAYGAKLTIAEMTTLAVIRFYVNPALMDHISIVRDKTSIKPDGSCDYNVFFDAATQLTDRDELDAAIRLTAGQTLPADAPADAIDPDLTNILPTDFISVGFAIDSDMAGSDSPADMSLHYSAGDNEFYFVPGFDPETSDTVDVPTKVETVTLNIPGPSTDGSMVLAVDPNVTDTTDPARYSYLSNLLPAGNITFPVVSQMSFADHGDGRENMATVLFYDWDDTLIGVLVVPRNDDARALVNDYVRDNMIHPDLRYGVGEYDKISSLARVDTYRGKYPATAPMADGATDSTVDMDGGKYPLTNKLDYVFMKRPMDLTSDSLTATGEPTSTWTQPGVDGAAEWDDEYPYIHGWALIPDADLTDIVYTHPENMWTTIGVGELSTYNGATNGGYMSMDGKPAVLTAIGQKFELANFDFHKNPQAKGTVYAVKALYEPGESLLIDGYPYRMISEPYYNKLNAGSASSGGAYSVDVTFERASAEVENAVHGVARMREPYVRQDTTSDLFWEENEDFGISHNLPNATNYEAYSEKGKTTYTKVDVSNVEEVSFALTLSARQNKVDYFLIEGYGFNFVAGGARSDGDGERRGTAGTADNYNYYVEDESDLTDEWHDATYENREGSKGFVLAGTLNQIMEMVTQCYSGSLERSTLYSYVTSLTLSDINLRMDGDGRKPDTFDDVEEMIDVLLAAVDDAKKNHYGDDDYWNSDPAHDCAQLNYHQLQLFVIAYKTNTAAKLLSPSAADAEIVKWCHLHEECVAKTSGKPRNWKELISTAQGPDSDAEKIRKISLLTAVEMEDIAHLRADSDGTPFATVDVFAAKVLAAVKAGHTSWDAVQDHIIRGVGDAAYAKANYWWYDGTQSVPLNSLSQLIDTTPDAFTAVTLPDGVKETRQGKLNQLLPAFTANAALPGDETDPAWVRATENLCADNDAGKFTDFDAFKTAFLDVVKKANDAAAAAGEDMTLWKPTWSQLQYAILHPTESFPLVPTTAQEEEFKTYYWHNGGRKVTDVSSLLLAAQRANQGDTVSWDAFNDVNDLYNYPGLQFRKNFAGEQYTAADFGAFKSTIQTLAVQGTNRTWEEVQYYLFHGSLGGSALVNSEAAYYWWKDGGVGESVDFTTITDYSTGLAVFLDAAFRSEINGNAHAWDGLTAAFDKVKLARLIKSDNGADTFDTLEHFASPSEFLAAINGISAAAGAQGAGPGQNLVKPDSNTITWQQMQKYLFEKTLVLDGAEDYWWRTADSQGTTKTPAEYFEEFRAALQEVIDSGGDTSSVDAWIKNVDNLNAVFFNLDSPETGFDQSYADMFAESGFIWQSVINDGGYTNASDISWYQLQYAFVMYGYSWMTDADIADTLTGMGITIPDWVPAPAMLLSEEAAALRAQLMARRPSTIVETDEATGITTVTTTVTTELEDGTTLRVVTVTVRDPIKNTVETRTITTLLDEEGNVLFQTVTEPVVTPVEPEEPVCACGGEDGIHTEDCPLYEAPVETEPPAETGEPTESPVPTDPAETPESEDSPDVSVSPEPEESQIPETSESPIPPETEEPAVTETPEGEPDAPIDPPETTQPTPPPEPEYTLETMPEVVDPELEEMGDEPIEEADASIGSSETEELDSGAGVPTGLSEIETIVVETMPPLGGPEILRNPLGATDYKRLTTKIDETKLRVRAGGVKMKQRKIKRIISPPGQLSVPLLLRTEPMERRSAV